MYETYLLVEILLGIVSAFIWGFATAAVRERKGYGRNWFWFGFFLGFVPLIIACAIPAREWPETEEDPYLYQPDRFAEPGQSLFADDEYVQKTVAEGGWQCACGRANPAYVSTCTCGISKRNNDPSAAQRAASARTVELEAKRQEAAAELRKCKVMLDAQLISLEEYNARVRELRRYL